MKIEKNLLPKSIVELIIEEDAKEIVKYRKEALSYLEKNSSIKGFRKGSKIPENILVKHFSEEYITKITIDFAIDNIYKTAIKKEKIIPIANGEIKEIISETPLKIRIHIEVIPEVIIDKKYKEIKLKKEKISVSDEELEDAIKDIKTKFTTFRELSDKNKKIKNGDKVTIDTDGYEGSILLETTSMRDYPIIIGSSILVPGFEEGLIGAKLDDELELDIKFPNDYHNDEFKGKETKFKVNIKKIEESIEPEFTPEFIEELRGQKLDFDGFKELIKTEIYETKESNSRLNEELQLIEALLKITTIDPGENIIKNQIEKVYAEIRDNLTKDGMKPADYLENIKLSEEDFKELHVKPIAIKRLQGELILHKISEEEKFEVSEEEIKKEIKNILQRFSSPDVLKRLEELYIPGSKYYEELKQRITYRKLIDSFFE